MAIYDKSGAVLTTTYSVDGTPLQYAYDKDGNQLMQADYYNAKFDVFVQRYIKANGMQIDGTAATKSEIEHYLLNRNNCLYRGKLHKSGKYLLDENDDYINIQGIGTHQVTQYPNLHTLANFEMLKYCGINCIRLSAYLNDHYFGYSDGQYTLGYLSEPDVFKAEMDKIIGHCITTGLYAIVDWHVWDGGGERLNTSSAVDFFTYFAQKYHDVPNVLYELANEPFGNSLTEIVNHCIACRNAVKTYVTDPIIIVPTKKYDYGVTEMYNALQAEGIDDVFISQHRYSSHANVSAYEGWWANDMPLFISEWSNTNASADEISGMNTTEGNAFLNFFNQNHIPNCIWKYTDQTMSYVVLANKGSINNAYYIDGPKYEDDYTEYGKFFFDRYSAFSFGT